MSTIFSGQDELWRTVPTSNHRGSAGDGTDADAFADFGQMLFMASIIDNPA